MFFCCLQVCTRVCGCVCSMSGEFKPGYREHGTQEPGRVCSIRTRYVLPASQGFMQDKIIASHTFWWTHTWMLTVKPVYKLLNVSDDLKWTTNTRDTILNHFQGITNNIYGFGRLFCSIFLPVHIRFYLSK